MSSSILNLPPRIQLRDRDNRGGANPSVANSSGDKRTGVRPVVFNDEDTIIFGASTQVYYPQVLISGSNYLTSTLPSTSQSGLLTSGRIVKGVSDTTLPIRSETDFNFGPFIDSNLPEQSTEQFFLTGTSASVLPGFSAPLKSKTIIKIDISTDETAIFTRYADTRGSVADPLGPYAGQDLTGFRYYNFSTKLWDQIGLTDPLPPSAPVHYDYAVELRSADESDLLSGTTSFPLQFIPGPAKALKIATDRAASEYTKIGTPTVSCMAPFLNNYHAVKNQTIRLSDYIQEPFLLEKAVISLPIEAQRTSAHFFDDTPFLHSQDNYVFFIYRQDNSQLFAQAPPPGGDGAPTPGRGLGIDSAEMITGSMRSIVLSASMAFYNTTASTIDTVPHAPREDRYYYFEPLNSPAFMYDFGIDPFATASLANTAVIGEFTGTVSLNAIPAVASAQILGHFNVPRSLNTFTGKESAKVWNFWPGGTSAYQFGRNDYHNKANRFSLGIGGLFNTPDYGNPTFAGYSDPVTPGLITLEACKDNLPIERIDPRAQKIFGGVTTNKSTAIGVTIGGQQSAQSPYLLTPEDTLIFGIDAGIPLAGNDIQHHNGLTGSIMKIMAGEASITLYGSLVKDGKEIHNGLNQNLTSENVSECLHFGNSITDQYELENKENFAQSMSDRIMTGTIASTNGREQLWSDVQSPRHSHEPTVLLEVDWRLPASRDRINQNPDPSSKIPLSVLNEKSAKYFRRRWRHTNLTTLTERFYDTMMPSIEDYVRASGGETTASYIQVSTESPDSATHVRSKTLGVESIIKFGTTEILHPPLAGISEASHRFLEQGSDRLYPNIFASNPKRFISNDYTTLAFSASVAPSAAAANPNPNYIFPYEERLMTNQAAIKFILFSRGFRSTNLWASSNVYVSTALLNTRSSKAKQGLTILHHGLTGSSGYKYGVQGTEPRYSNIIFRNNRFGQFRDMLEQRKFGTFFDELGSKREGSQSGKKGKKRGPVSIKWSNAKRTELIFGGGFRPLSGSSNRSTAATSSIPYDDGNFSNWDEVY